MRACECEWFPELVCACYVLKEGNLPLLVLPKRNSLLAKNNVKRYVYCLQRKKLVYLCLFMYVCLRCVCVCRCVWSIACVSSWRCLRGPRFAGCLSHRAIIASLFDVTYFCMLYSRKQSLVAGHLNSL